MIKILKILAIIQEVSNDKRQKNGLKKLGRGYSEAIRLNPYNPLSYIALIIAFIICLLMFGIVGVFKEIAKNPFAWD